MAKIEMKVRKIKTGETLVATLESFEDTLTWLEQRPEYMEVLGVLSEDLSTEQHQQLKEAMRPYTEEERRAIEAADRAVSEAIAERVRQEAEMAKQRMAEHEKAMENADPNRPMVLRWHHEEGLSLSDNFDTREIPQVVRDAVDAWIAERTSWVHDRGKMIVEATITAYPGPIPSGLESDRIIPGGNFVTGFTH